ncbi:putative DNA-dependent protein kinase catalytic subunit [Phytophthora cinnamomi]|uniref:putative DNA-dependent protein kinase catalytic subunit n=1 Tax=Phytophthora cinnamomi TaxID=4785 RepID=UPI00355AA099|nr:putative DNA-dependent protein kinase catalytic subunit [Phytophthora cinnamomi]
MESKVGERLEELAAFLAHQHALDSVEETLGHLQTEITDAMVRSRASAQRCTILLFQSAEPPSLLHFLAASADFADDARKREISAARGSVLELLASFLKAYGTHRALTKQHVVDTYKACQQTARADPFNRVKAHALEVIVNVLKYADTRVSKDDIEPRAYVDKLFYDIKFSKATQTAKGQMLEVIGHLVEKFPQDMEDAATPLLDWSEDALEKQFSSNAPEMMMVNGLLFALARLLECDPERYMRDEGLRKKIYSYLLTVFATTVSGNLSRYHVTNSSEIFLAKHAQLFQQEIGPNGYVWFTYMKFCCMSGNKTVKEHAFVCSNAIFQTLDSYMVKTKDDSRKKCFNKILKDVLPIISDSAAAPYPDIVAEFEQHVLTKVPLWTCLQWSAQLMALLNGPIGRSIVAILEKMAEKYPVALFYDFMVTCRSSLKSFKVDLHRLEVLLANSVMEKFVAALRLIHHPEIRLKEGLREIANLLEDNRTSDAKHKVELLWKDCFSPDRPLLGAQIGRYNRDWSQKARRDVEKIMGKDGSKLAAKSVNTAREWIMNHFSVTPGRYGITKDMKAHLGDFAEWLEEFDHSNCLLELPGQYTAYWGPPDPSTHIRILSFDSMLGVLASKQLPKRLTLRCSDEKDYTFLVKGGEDLRLDQRIEQLFGVMNQILEADPRCRDQMLSLITYNVIPMTQEIGILEWVDGTSTLKGVIEAQLQIDDRCTDLKSNKRQKLELFNTTAAKAYEAFLMKQRGASFSAKVVAPRSKDVVEQFAKVQAMIPGDLLRRQLLGLGSNFEAFLLVRDRFLKSLAVFNACSYVLGIGDRHLDNFLFNLSNGCVIGIDFGVSFGAGASILPVPELIPFRYTRQMDFVFQPYDGANLLAQEMQAVFDALRAKRQVVESVMNVFLHEPLLDWQQSTTTHQKALFEVAEGDDRSTLQDSDVEMEDVEEVTPTRASRSGKKSTASPAGSAAATAWLPDVKIAIARRKLEGVSPGLLLKEELSQNAHLKQHISKFHALVDAASSSENDTHEVAAMSSLSQAQELLAMATAPDLLGRTFQGWMPWL